MAHEKARSVVDLITNIAVAAAALAIVWRIFSSPAPRIELQAPSPTPAAIENLEPKQLSTTLSNAARKGNAGAPVILIEFSDYECPFCGKHARDTFAQIDKEFVENGTISGCAKRGRSN